MHIDWRPDIYKYSETVLPIEVYKQALNEGTFFIAEYDGIELQVNAKNETACPLSLEFSPEGGNIIITGKNIV